MSETERTGRPHLFVIRHGATEWSRNGRHTGITDLPLLPEGEEQARATAQLVAGQDVRPRAHLARCSGRATPASSSAWATRPRSTTTSASSTTATYEGVTTATIRETVPGWTVWTHPCPGGETLEQAAVRVDRVIDRARAANGDVAVFAHGHILRILTARWCELDPIEGRRFVLHTATLSELGWEHDEPAVILWNSR